MILQTVLDFIQQNLETLQFLPFAIGFTSQYGDTIAKGRLVNRLNSAPVRPDSINPRDPRRTSGFNMYRRLAEQTGPTPQTQIALRQQNFDQGNAADQITQANAIPAAGGNRIMNALRGAGQRFGAQQNLQGTSGNSIMDILKQNNETRVKGLGAWSNLENAHGQARQKAGMDAYEQDIKRYAATMAARAAMGM